MASESLDETPPLEDGPDAGPRHSVTEVATFRSDAEYSDGRHPDQVRYTSSPEEDVRRRDFTINGLMLDPSPLVSAPPEHRAAAVRAGRLDWVGGLPDLDAGVIRAIGEPVSRFREDRLRLLRAIRFAARFSFDIEPATRAAICEMAPRIQSVSRERVRDELTKMLTEGGARRRL